MKIMTSRLVRFALNAVLVFLFILLILLVAAFAGQQWAWRVLVFVGELLFGPSGSGDPL